MRTNECLSMRNAICLTRRRGGRGGNRRFLLYVTLPTSCFRHHASDSIVVCHMIDANLGAIPFVSRGGAEAIVTSYFTSYFRLHASDFICGISSACHSMIGRSRPTYVPYLQEIALLPSCIRPPPPPKQGIVFAVTGEPVALEFPAPYICIGATMV